MQRILLLFLLSLPLGLYAFATENADAHHEASQGSISLFSLSLSTVRDIPPPDTFLAAEVIPAGKLYFEEGAEDMLAYHGLGLEFVLSPEVLEPFTVAAAAPAESGLSFEAFLLASANEFESKRILYRSIPLSDCSGMFHRLLRKVREQFPDFQYPEVVEARSSRALAQWYHDHGALEIISDAAGSGRLIRPGAVMFFGQSGRKFAKPTIGQLVNGGIQHIGTVVEVQRDENGQTIGYTMFHARSRGKIAGKTRHYLRHPKYSYLPAFGNWRQQLVAIGYINTEAPGQIAAK